MKDIFLNPKTNGDPDAFLRSQGVKLRPSPDEHFLTSIREGKYSCWYGFRELGDFEVFAEFLMDNQVGFSVPPVSVGAKYPYHLGFTNTLF